MVIADWISVLGDVPQQATEEAILEYLRGDSRRGQGDTLMAHIRKRALARVETPPPPDADHERPFGPTLISSDELVRRREIASELGMEVLENGMPKADLNRFPKAGDVD